MATTSPSGVTTQPAASTDGQRASAYTLKGMFSEPLYVFVKARNVSEADIERLGVKNAYAVGVAADFVERSVKPGEVVKKTVRGESVMLAQKNGPFGSVDSKPADVKVELPRGVELISSRAFWTTNGKESSKTATTPVRRGTVLAASGTLLGNDVSWGSRTWGELNLEVEYRVPSTSTDVKVVEQLQPSKVVTERQFVLPLPKDKPIPAELRVELQDVAVDDRKETVTLLSPAGNAKTSTAMALDGRFELALDVEKRTLTVTRKSSAAR